LITQTRLFAILAPAEKPARKMKIDAEAAQSTQSRQQTQLYFAFVTHSFAAAHCSH